MAVNETQWCRFPFGLPYGILLEALGWEILRCCLLFFIRMLIPISYRSKFSSQLPALPPRGSSIITSFPPNSLFQPVVNCSRIITGDLVLKRSAPELGAGGISHPRCQTGHFCACCLWSWTFGADNELCWEGKVMAISLYLPWFHPLSPVCLWDTRSQQPARDGVTGKGQGRVPVGFGPWVAPRRILGWGGAELFPEGEVKTSL